VDEPSDMRGLIYIPFKERVEEATLPLLKALQAAKFTCKIDSL
jgi:predicted nucleotide-binding protein